MSSRQSKESREVGLEAQRFWIFLLFDTYQVTHHIDSIQLLVLLGHQSHHSIAVSTANLAN